MSHARNPAIAVAVAVTTAVNLKNARALVNLNVKAVVRNVPALVTRTAGVISGDCAKVGGYRLSVFS